MFLSETDRWDRLGLAIGPDLYHEVKSKGQRVGPVVEKRLSPQGQFGSLKGTPGVLRFSPGMPPEPKQKTTPGIRDKQIGFYLFLLALAIRVIFLFITPNNGVDAMARYSHAMDWLNDPTSLPSATADFAWLPLHFWLLGGAIWVWHSEWSARILTALLGALTIPFYWGTMKRAFGDQIALASSIAFAIFGFHIGYSVTTSSEVPTIFFLSVGLYAWARYYLEPKWIWAVLSSGSFGAACLTRFEPWLVVPVLGFMLLVPSDGSNWRWPNGSALWKAACFAIPASAAMIGWLLFSWMKWGDPLMLPHRTIVENISDLAIYRLPLPILLILVPVQLLTSLSPLLACLALAGLVIVFQKRSQLSKSIALLFLTMCLFNFYYALRLGGIQPKYTLIYSWLAFPFAFVALPWAEAQFRFLARQTAPWLVLLSMVLWQAVVVLTNTSSSAMVADSMIWISPTLPLRREMRELEAWLKLHHSSSDAVLIDEDKNESDFIVRFPEIGPAMAFTVAPEGDRDPQLVDHLKYFVRQRRPSLLICSVYGPLGRRLSSQSDVDREISTLNLRLHKEWQGERWTVFSIDQLR